MLTVYENVVDFGAGAPLPPLLAVEISLNWVDQITCPPTRIRPQWRGIEAPSLAPVRRNRSTRPTSTGSDPPASTRWSMLRPMVAPTARPITAPDRPRTVPPKPAPTAAPTADNRMVAMFSLPRER